MRCRSTRTRLGRTNLDAAAWPCFAYATDRGATMQGPELTTRVVHVNKHEYDVYIGRPSPFGNPFVLGKDGTRPEVLVKYRHWLAERLQDDLFRAKVLALRGKRLGCYCVPSLCHGHVLAEYISRPDVWTP